MPLRFDPIIKFGPSVKPGQQYRAVVLEGFEAGRASRPMPRMTNGVMVEPSWTIKFINGTTMRVSSLEGRRNEIEDYCRSMGLERPPER